MGWRRHGEPQAPGGARNDIARLGGFSDAVLAIAITVLVLDLRVGSGLSEEDMLDALRGLGPELFGFALSFWVIGRFWLSHHRMFRHLNGYDDRLLVLNLMFLSSVVFLPFPTAVLGQYLHHRWALFLYAVSVAFAGALFTLLWVHIAYWARLVTLEGYLRRSLLLRFASVPAVFLVSMPVILLGWLHAATAMWVLLPPAVRVLLALRQRPHGGDALWKRTTSDAEGVRARNREAGR